MFHATAVGLTIRSMRGRRWQHRRYEEAQGPHLRILRRRLDSPCCVLTTPLAFCDDWHVFYLDPYLKSGYTSWALNRSRGMRHQTELNIHANSSTLI